MAKTNSCMNKTKDVEGHALTFVPEYSWPVAGCTPSWRLGQNMIVEGDNAHALTLLEATHREQVQCVYIDPPYNTGASHEYYQDGRASREWLDWMMTILERLRTLLRPQGSLFVHLDDNEVDYVKVALDELFGREQFVSRITVAARAAQAEHAQGHTPRENAACGARPARIGAPPSCVIVIHAMHSSSLQGPDTTL